MADKRRAVLSLLLLGLMGCHQDEPEAIERAKQEHFHAKQMFTDRASLLFAEQEVGLADAKAAVARSSGPPLSAAAEQAASNHLQQARLQLKLDVDNLQIDEDLERAKSFARQLAGPHASEGHL